MEKNEIEENYSSEELLNEDPKKLIEILIKKKELEVPENLEKKILEKYTVNIDKKS